MVAIVRSGSELLVNAQSTGVQEYSSIAKLSHGNLVITWEDDNSATYGDNSGFGIKAKILDPSGTTVRSEFVVNTGTIGDQGFPGVAALSNFNFVITWTDESGSLGGNNGDAIYAQLYSEDGTKIGSELLVNTQTAGDQYESVVASTMTGGFVIAWTDESHTLGDSSGTSIKAQIFNPNGTKSGSEFLVNTQTANDQENVHISVASNGNELFVWTDYSGTLGDNSGSSIKARIYNFVGAVFSSEILVNTQTVGNQNSPAVAALTTGGYVVTWYDSSTSGDGSGGCIKAQVLNGNPVKVGSEFVVNTQASGDQELPVVAALSNGRFVIAWTDFASQGDGSGYSIKAQVFESNGTKLGSEFLVNTQAQGNQVFPAVTALANGGFVITWDNGDVNDIKAQIYSVLAGPLVTVDDLTTNAHTSSDAAPYSGPVAGVQYQYINIINDNLNVTGLIPNGFIHTGSGFDAIDVSHVNGTNVLDGGTNSNFLVGGTAAGSFDTFFVDNRSPPGDIWSTVVNFHKGDDATVWGVTQAGFNLAFANGEGAAGFTGLTLHVTKPGVPTASLTLAGYTTADLTNGKLSTTFGTVGGSDYFFVHGNS